MNSEKSNFIYLTPSEISYKSLGLHEGTGDPEDARLLLGYFCQLVNDKEEIPRILLVYLSDSFKDYLNEEKTIQGALGLVKKKGRPAADIEKRQKMAAEVLRLRLQGVPHQTALIEVSEKFNCGETIVGEAWKENKFGALELIFLERPEAWTENEKKILIHMFSKEIWFLN